MLLLLPHEIIEEICQELDTNGLRNCRVTCKALCNLINPKSTIKTSDEIQFEMQISNIAKNAKIEELIFDTSYTNPNNLLLISHVLRFPTNLTILSIRYAKKFDDECLKVIPSTITDLDIASTLVTDVGLGFLPNNLKTLNISFCNVTDIGIAKIPRSITDIDIFCCQEVTNKSIESLPKDLKRINLYGCNKITRAGIIALPHKLESLSLDFHLSVTNDVIHTLPSTLLSLSLTYCNNITDSCFEYLPVNLTSLDLVGMQKELMNIILKGLRVSDSSLIQLSRLTSLQTLNLYNVRSITEMGLRNLPTTLQSVYTEVITKEKFPFRTINYNSTQEVEMEDA